MIYYIGKKGKVTKTKKAVKVVKPTTAIASATQQLLAEAASGLEATPAAPVAVVQAKPSTSTDPVSNSLSMIQSVAS